MDQKIYMIIVAVVAIGAIFALMRGGEDVTVYDTPEQQDYEPSVAEEPEAAVEPEPQEVVEEMEEAAMPEEGMKVHASEGACGDGILDTGEECDGPYTETCESRGYSGGSLGCEACVFVTRNCFTCGNGACEGVQGENGQNCPEDCGSSDDVALGGDICDLKEDGISCGPNRLCCNKDCVDLGLCVQSKKGMEATCGDLTYCCTGWAWKEGAC